MADTTQKIIGALLLVLLSTGVVYISMNEAGVKMRIDNDKATFYVKPTSWWVVSGREYSYLFDGTSRMNRIASSINITTEIDNYSVNVIRETKYIRGPVIIETWYFDGSLNDVEMFPIDHKIEIFNASGKFYRYEVKDLVYNGITYKLSGETEFEFGRNMKLELHPGYRWGWVYQYGGVRVQYDIPTDYEVYNVRLFDPVTINLTLEGSESNIHAELGSKINITATINNIDNVCVDIVDHPAYGVNYSCDTNTSFLFNTSSFVLTEFNDSSKSNILGGGSTLEVIDYDCINNNNWQPYPCTNIFDKDWFSFAHGNESASTGYLYLNYTYPAWSTLADTVLTYKYRDNDGITTHTYSEQITSACFNATSTGEFQIRSDYNPPRILTMYCRNLNSGAWRQFFPSGKPGWKDGTVYEIEIVAKRTTTLSINLDNRTDLASAQINITGSGNATDIEIDFGADNTLDVFLLGLLNGNILEYSGFMYGSVDYDTKNITFGSAGTDYVYVNISVEGLVDSGTLQLYGYDVDSGLNLNFYDYFNATASTYINSSTSVGAAPLVSLNNFERGSSSYVDWSQEYSTNSDPYPSGCGGTACSQDQIWVPTSNVSSGLYKNHLRHSQATSFGMHFERYVRWIEDTYEGYDYRNVSMIEVDLHNYMYGDKTGSSSTRCGLDLYSKIYLTDGSNKIEMYSKELGSFSTTKTINEFHNVTIIRQGDLDSNTWKVYVDDVYSETADVSILKQDSEWYLLLQDYAWKQSYYSDCQSKYNITTEYQDIRTGGIGLARAVYNSSGYNSSGNIVYSINLTNFTKNVEAATLYSGTYEPDYTNITYYLSNDNSNWTRVVPTYRQAFDDAGSEIYYRVDMVSSPYLTGVVKWLRIVVAPASGENITIDIGSDGVIDWSYVGILNSSTSPQSVDLTNNSAIDYYVGDICTGLTCMVPLEISLEAGGVIAVQNLSLNRKINPIIINTSLIEDINGDIEFEFEFIDGNITLSDLQIYYLGGSQIFEVLAHNPNRSSNKSYNVTFYHSDYNWTFPSKINYLEFIPRTPYSKNVTPYGQKRSNPIFNVTTNNWGGRNMNFSIWINESYSCVNLTAATSFNKSAGTLLTNNTWHSFASNQTNQSEIDIWFWADYDCNYTTWMFWEPEIAFRGCCYNCLVCDTDVT